MFIGSTSNDISSEQELSGFLDEVQFTVLVSAGTGLELRSPRRLMPERCQEAAERGKREGSRKNTDPSKISLHLPIFIFYF